jgi:hypothetical protein
MAKRVKIIMTDDIDGGEATQTVRFGLDGREMEIDLTDANAIKLRKALLPYISAGRRVRSAPPSRQPASRPSAEAGEAARRTTR